MQTVNERKECATVEAASFSKACAQFMGVSGVEEDFIRFGKLCCVSSRCQIGMHRLMQAWTILEGDHGLVRVLLLDAFEENGQGEVAVNGLGTKKIRIEHRVEFVAIHAETAREADDDKQWRQRQANIAMRQNKSVA
ncbi:hypothetical protein JCM15831A_23920 [Asaia astilbis]